MPFGLHHLPTMPPDLQAFANIGTLPNVIPEAAKQKVSQACARYCARDNRSFEEIKGRGFKDLINEVTDIAFKYNSGKFTAEELLPDQTTVSRYVGKEAERLRQKLLAKTKPIRTVLGGGITLEFWEEEYTKNSYLGVTAHYFKGWVLQEKLLLCAEWDTMDRKTAEIVGAFLFRKLATIKLLESELKNVIYVTDASSNVKAAFTRRNKPILSRITCAGHQLNTGIRKCFNTNPKSCRRHSCLGHPE
ncbi:hypothetical protein RvY_09322 [Ramazzottius varieornatus]|uniref:Hermes trasposase DNA-binding domain-containing protein n=1 Tax=Ramazzottius varieornatus TaxID=947166 RepID=A0A1D1V8W8_RAMVA|nr:hypothetical protein RvY_09322 [Ramazzottius varieornatus]